MRIEGFRFGVSGLVFQGYRVRYTRFSNSTRQAVRCGQLLGGLIDSSPVNHPTRMTMVIVRRLETWDEEEVRVKWKTPPMTSDQMLKTFATLGVPVQRY